MINHKRILVVDNEPMVLFTFRQTLQALGKTNEIVTARSGPEALREIRKKPCDLVITALTLPGMNGIELTETIRVLNPEATVVWITTDDSRGFASDAKRLGVTCCREKPLEIQEILQLAKDALGDDE
jgi:DNA-binding NarL/FixJ family response regulator